MSTPPNYELIVFDWDGTLMDSESRIVACLEASIMDLGLQMLEKTVLRDVIGLGLAEAMQRLFPDADQPTCQRLIDRYRYHYLEANHTPSELFEGADEVVRGLRDSGYLLAVATGKGRRGLNEVLERTALGPLFHATRCADETFSKPHPQMLEEIMDELGVEAGRTVMVGDTEYDLQMATNAGTASIAVTYGVHSQHRLEQHKPVACLSQITELPQWLAQGRLGAVV